jgi:hypothetical protein
MYIYVYIIIYIHIYIYVDIDFPMILLTCNMFIGPKFRSRGFDSRH